MFLILVLIDFISLFSFLQCLTIGRKIVFDELAPQRLLSQCCCCLLYTSGIAGGPLIIAILIGRYGYKMKLVTYTTTSANMMLREIGLVLFLASVGIKAGASFVETVVEGDGLKYVYTGVLITVIPILIIGTIARLKYKFNYFTIMGMLAGTCTDPPAFCLLYTSTGLEDVTPQLERISLMQLSNEALYQLFEAQQLCLCSLVHRGQ